VIVNIRITHIDDGSQIKELVSSLSHIYHLFVAEDR